MGYTLNANGWRTAIARPGGKDDTYTYDTTGQVLTAAAANTAGPTSESFAYDLASNRTASSATPPDGVQGDTPMTYAANSLDQYTSLNGQAQTHDANGNTLLLRQPAHDDVTFDWDSENRMLVQERGGSDPARIVNHYDALHRRVKKEIFEKPGGTFVLVKTHSFIYDGWNVIEERQFNSGGTLAALTRLTWGADLSGTMQGAGGVGGLLMAEEVVVVAGVVDPGQSPTAHYYWYDGNGNVTGITDDSGTIEGTYRYTSFGAFAETVKTTAFAEDQPWKFSTKYHDTEVEPVAGTYYYGYRSYLPSVGRWPSRDPIGEEGGINLYGGLNNDAINRWDYLGLAELWTYSGINSFRNGAILDYVNDDLRRNGFDSADRSTASSAGTGSPYTDEPNDELLNVGSLRSEKVLNAEAAALATKQVTAGGLCCKNARILMIAPKTTTIPIKDRCCGFKAVVYWSPYDAVPNQRVRLFRNTESQAYWSQWGDVHTVDSRGNRGGGQFGNHTFSAFLGSNPVLNGRRLTYRGKPDSLLQRRPRPTGAHAPDPLSYLKAWQRDEDIDIIVVCHSQGCNIAMHVLNRGCRKGESQ